jgi:DNA mismatch repair ATPase MutS
MEKLLFINENEWNVLRHLPNEFDNGSELKSRALFTDDLDIIGQGSLYHLLNRTTTSHGSEKLGQILSHPLMDSHQIHEQQEATRQLLHADCCVVKIREPLKK